MFLELLNWAGIVNYITKSLNRCFFLCPCLCLFVSSSLWSIIRKVTCSAALQCPEDAEKKSLTHWLNEWQGHLWSCLGQQKGDNIKYSFDLTPPTPRHFICSDRPVLIGSNCTKSYKISPTNSHMIKCNFISMTKFDQIPIWNVLDLIAWVSHWNLSLSYLIPT